MRRFFAPIYMQQSELWPIRLAINAGSRNIRASVAYHGLVNFTPVLATNVIANHFNPIFLANPYPRLEVDALRGCEFRYAYKDDGTYDGEATETEPVRFAASLEELIIGDIVVPKSLKSGDILLCSKEYPLRGDRLRAIQDQIAWGSAQLR